MPTTCSETPPSLGLNLIPGCWSESPRDQSGDSVIELIEEAAAAHLVERKQLPGEYRFAHALVRQTLLSEISPAFRVRLHARIASESEALWGASADDHAAELAYHFSEAYVGGESEKVIYYSNLAGHRALATHAPSQAAAHFQKALDTLMLKTQPSLQQAKLRFGLARALMQILERYELQRAADELLHEFRLTSSKPVMMRQPSRLR